MYAVVAILIALGVLFEVTRAGVPILRHSSSSSSASLSISATEPQRWIVATTKNVAAGDTSDNDAAERLCRDAPAGACGSVFENAFHGLVVEMTEEDLIDFLATHEASIRYAEEPAMIYTLGTEDLSIYPANDFWSLDRIDQRTSTLDQTYRYEGSGAGVNVYILDTPIYSAHSDFRGELIVPPSGSFQGQKYWSDSLCKPNGGHGTHVAALAGGVVAGVAKEATLYSIAALGCDGQAEVLDVMYALEFLATDMDLGVISMSIGGAGRVVALGETVRNVIDMGFIVLTASGNEGTDACNTSPAYLPEVITVGATEIDDTMASYSNKGSCVDLLAPGTDVFSAGISSPTAYVSLSGTSMSTPLVSGGAALYLEKSPTASAFRVMQALSLASSKGKIVSNTLSGTTNKLLYVRKLGLKDIMMSPERVTVRGDVTDVVNNYLSLEYAFSLAVAPSANVVITLSLSDSSRGSLNDTSITFTTTDWDQERIVLLTMSDTSSPESIGESFFLNVEVTSTTDTNYVDQFVISELADHRAWINMPGSTWDQAIPLSSLGSYAGSIELTKRLPLGPICDTIQGTSGSYTIENSGQMWYTFTPSSDMVVTIDTCNSNFDTFLVVLNETSVDNWVGVCNDDWLLQGSAQTLSDGYSCTINFSSSYMYVSMKAHTKYYIAVFAYADSKGKYTLRLRQSSSSSASSVGMSVLMVPYPISFTPSDPVPPAGTANVMVDPVIETGVRRDPPAPPLSFPTDFTPSPSPSPSSPSSPSASTTSSTALSQTKLLILIIGAAAGSSVVVMLFAGRFIYRRMRERAAENRDARLVQQLSTQLPQQPSRNLRGPQASRQASGYPAPSAPPSAYAYESGYGANNNLAGGSPPTAPLPPPAGGFAYPSGGMQANPMYYTGMPPPLPQQSPPSAQLYPSWPPGVYPPPGTHPAMQSPPPGVGAYPRPISPVDDFNSVQLRVETDSPPDPYTSTAVGVPTAMSLPMASYPHVYPSDSNPTPSRTATAPERATGPWSCEQCTLVNTDDCAACIACDAPRPQGASLAPPRALYPQLSEGNNNRLPPLGERTLGIQEPHDSRLVRGWVCTRCTLYNPDLAGRCEACGSWREEQ